jgi:hypothetical protein
MLLQPLDVPGDGNCLFAALAHIVLDRVSRGRRWSEGEADKMVTSVAQLLRSKVAGRVLSGTDADADGVVGVWHKLWKSAVREKNAELQVEFRHMSNVGYPLTALDRRILFRNMMNPAIYWGDEFALRSLEQLLQCRLCVIDSTLRVIRREPGPPQRPDFIAFLLLRNQHYQPLRSMPESRFAWDPAELPAKLRSLLDSWLAGTGRREAGAPSAAKEPEGAPSEAARPK